MDMSDYTFGNKIYRLRKNIGLSQNQLADMLGISGKAISKWETGCAKPQLDTIKKLSAIFNVTVDELLCSSVPEKQITKIVITGGPCAGKTTGKGQDAPTNPSTPFLLFHNLWVAFCDRFLYNNPIDLGRKTYRRYIA